MKFNAEQITEYLNMEAQYKVMTKHFEQVSAMEMGEADYTDLCRRYAQATIHMVKLRSFVRGSRHGHQA
jgi:hypothetical protein